MTQFKTLEQIRKQMLLLPQDKFWPVGPEAGSYLSQLVSTNQPNKLLELGTSSGYSTTWLLEGLSDHKAELITIESNQERYNIAQKFFQQIDFKNTNLKHIRHHAPEVFSEIDLTNLDFIFCDAIKKQTLELYLYLKEFMTPNAVFIADNVISHRQSMNDLFQYLQDNKVTHQIISKGAGLLVIPYQ